MKRLSRRAIGWLGLFLFLIHLVIVFVGYTSSEAYVEPTRTAVAVACIGILLILDIILSLLFSLSLIGDGVMTNNMRYIAIVVYLFLMIAHFVDIGMTFVFTTNILLITLYGPVVVLLEWLTE